MESKNYFCGVLEFNRSETRANSNHTTTINFLHIARMFHQTRISVCLRGYFIYLYSLPKEYKRLNRITHCCITYKLIVGTITRLGRYTNNLLNGGYSIMDATLSSAYLKPRWELKLMLIVGRRMFILFWEGRINTFLLNANRNLSTAY